jgi:predicted SprT family Zn-dependent metalloprotease
MKHLKKQNSSTAQLVLTFEAEAADDPKSVLALLHAEFDRLNAEHFEGSLTCPEIVLSKRKAFGGYYQPRRHRIVLSWQAYEEHGWNETLNTFRHEVAHIVHPNHSKAFWTVANQLGATQRYASAPKIQPRTPHKYVYMCPKCERKYFRNRRFRKASCGVCDKKFNPEFLLRLVKN